MTDLPIHISTHHLQLSDALRDFVRKKIAPVNRFASDALAAEIVLRRHGGAKRRFSASARVAWSRRLRSHRSRRPVCRNLPMRRLARLLRKRKTRLGRILERRTPTYTANQPLRQRIEKDLALTAPTRERPLRKKADTQEIRVFPFRRRAVLSPCLHAESR